MTLSNPEITYAHPVAAAPAVKQEPTEKAAPAPEVKKEAITMVNAITADLLEDSVRLKLGEGYYKLVTYEDFLGTLTDIVSKEKIKTAKKEEYHLPTGCMYFSTTGKEIEITCYYPECHREINYGAHKRLSVVPNILISHLLKKDGDKWKVADTKYMATNQILAELPRKFYAPGTGIAILPFTNVYNDGRLCYGGNVRIAEVIGANFKVLHWYYEVLFTSPFNNDLGIAAVKRSSVYASDYAAWYKLLADLATQKKPFPYNELTAFS